MTTKASKLWEIRHLDLSLPLPNLVVSEGTQGICAFFWWKSIPLGQMEIESQSLPLQATQLLQQLLPIIAPAVGSHLLRDGFQAPLPGIHRSLQRRKMLILSELMAICNPLHELEQTLDRAASNQRETVSVVICTRDRPHSLARCLQSLVRLTTAAHEVIVIDNAPTSDATQQLVANFQGVRYFRESRPGLSVARNRGIEIAGGEVIAFTDDDVEVHPHWLEQLRTAFRHTKVMAMTGLILPARLETKAEEAFQRGASGFGWGYRPLTFDSFFFEAKKPYGVPVWFIGAGANMAFRREIFQQLGGFDERLGAGASGCSEDSEFWYRILVGGWACQYIPTAVVYHHHRADLNSFSQQMNSYMRGHVVALLVQAKRHYHWGNLRRLFTSLPRHYAKELILGSLHLFRGKYRTVFPEIKGCLMALPYYFLHPTAQSLKPDKPDTKVQRIKSLS